jgi:hypothetical protein
MSTDEYDTDEQGGSDDEEIVKRKEFDNGEYSFLGEQESSDKEEEDHANNGKKNTSSQRGSRSKTCQQKQAGVATSAVSSKRSSQSQKSQQKQANVATSAVSSKCSSQSQQQQQHQPSSRPRQQQQQPPRQQQQQPPRQQQPPGQQQQQPPRQQQQQSPRQQQQQPPRQQQQQPPRQQQPSRQQQQQPPSGAVPTGAQQLQMLDRMQEALSRLEAQQANITTSHVTCDAESIAEFFTSPFRLNQLHSDEFFERSNSFSRLQFLQFSRDVTDAFLSGEKTSVRIGDRDSYNCKVTMMAVNTVEALRVAGYPNVSMQQVRTEFKDAVQRKKARRRVQKRKANSLPQYDADGDEGNDGDGDGNQHLRGVE